MPKAKTMEVSTYDWAISVKKFFTGLLFVGIPFIITYAIGFLEAETFPPEYAGLIVFVVGVLHLLANAFKHYGDTTTIEV